VDEITTEVVLTAKVSRLTSTLPAIDVPPPLTAAYAKPTKDDVVNAHQRRFAEQQTSSDAGVS